MNRIWFLIAMISICFGLVNSREEEMINALFNVPKDSIYALFKIGSMLIIYNGIFEIAINSNAISKMTILINKPVKKLFDLEDDNIIELISTSIICNLLGLGPANMSIALKIIEKLSNTNNKKAIILYLLINISSLCLLPLSLLALRSSFNSKYNIEFIPMIFIASSLTTILSIIIVKIIYRRKNE